ncbi:MAG: hypothetical protein ACRC0E_10600 [Soonwooa sp.]
MNDQELKENGFVFQDKGKMEDGDYYKWWKLKIRDIAIYYTIEYTAKNDVITDYWEVNEHKLNNPTKGDILTLIRILNN